MYCDNKDIQIPSKHNKIYYTLPLQDYMFRLLRVIIRPSNELIQDYLIPSAFWDPVALTIVGAYTIAPTIVNATGSQSALGIR